MTPQEQLRVSDHRTFHSTLFHSTVALLGLYAMVIMALAATDGHHDTVNALLGLAGLAGCLGIEMRDK